MITNTLVKTKLSVLKSWFEQYVNQYLVAFPQFESNLLQKKIHTDYVCQLILTIGKSLHLSQKEMIIAEIIALLHDVGRFEQFTRYQTFSDNKSLNHGQLGLKIIKDNQLLSEFDLVSQNIINKSVLYHNQYLLPDNENEQVLFFAKLIRDADKLDIYRLFVDYYQNRCYNDNSLVHGLYDDGQVSEQFCLDILNGQMPSKDKLTRLNDFKLLQISWIFDLNYNWTFQYLYNNNYLKKIFNTMPQTEIIKQVYDFTQQYLMENR